MFTESQRRKAILDVVHEYATFVSSAEMVRTGRHAERGFDPPVNSHIYHACLLNCRKMMDFFRDGEKDDVVAGHYVTTVTFDLKSCEAWRDPINKQLCHITYIRSTPRAKEITKTALMEMANELMGAWKVFGEHLRRADVRSGHCALAGPNTTNGEAA